MKPRRHLPITYTMMDELLASTTTPLPGDKQRHQLARMPGGLHEMLTADKPSTDAWRVLSDAVNLLETLVIGGEAPVRDAATGKVIASHWRGCDGQPVEVRDSCNLLGDAIAALAEAGKRAFNGQPLRLTGPGLHAVRCVLQDYEAALQHLPARTMVRCHRATEKRIREIFKRIDSMPDGVHVMAV